MPDENLVSAIDSLLTQADRTFRAIMALGATLAVAGIGYLTF